VSCSVCTELEKSILSWRVVPAQDQDGWFVYFDASQELLTLRDLTEAEKSATLDKLGSVSALSPSSDTLPDQMDAFEGSPAGEPSPSFLEDLWEGFQDE